MSKEEHDNYTKKELQARADELLKDMIMKPKPFRKKKALEVLGE